MKIILTVKERLSTINFLPKEGSTSEQVIGKNILEKTKLSKAEQEKVKPDIFYKGEIDPDTNFVKEISFSDEEFRLMYNQYRKMEDERRVNQLTVDLALKLQDAKSILK